MRRPLRLLRPLGFGPASEVWLAMLGSREVVVRRHVALAAHPFPPPPAPGVLAALRHPCIVRLLDHGVDADGIVVHVFERLAGRPLAEAARAGLDATTITRCLAAISDALHFMHEQAPVAPRIHGDLSPRNVVLLATGRPKLIDLLATRPGEHPAGPGVIVGTLPFLAPEVLAGGPPVEASDVWALASTLVWAARGDLPWAAESSPEDVLAAIRSTPPAVLLDGLGLPARVVATLRAMLDREPGRRPLAREICEELRPRRRAS